MPTSRRPADPPRASTTTPRASTSAMRRRSRRRRRSWRDFRQILVLVELEAQLLERVAHAALDRVLRNTDDIRDLLERHVEELAHEKHFALFFREGGDRALHRLVQ